MQLSQDPSAIHAASPRDILPALQAQLHSSTFDRHSLILLVKAVLAHPLLLDDCILVCGLLCHKHDLSLSNDDVQDELRYLWFQVALARAKFQDGTFTNVSMLLEYTKKALSLDEHILVAKCLECIPITALPNEFVPLLMDTALVPSALVQFRLRELVRALHSSSSDLIPQISHLVNVLPGDSKIKYQLFTTLQQCPLDACKLAMGDRGLAPAVSECMVFADKDKLIEWITIVEDDHLASMICTHLLGRIKSTIKCINNARHPLIQLTICDLSKTTPALALLQSAIWHKAAPVRLRSLQHLLCINNKNDERVSIKGTIKQAMLEALLGESPEFRQQFIKLFHDHLLRDANLVNEALALIWSDVCPRTTPFPRLVLTLDLAHIAGFSVDPCALITLIRRSTFGSIQALAYELLFDSTDAPSSINPKQLQRDTWADLIHPRPCINEGAALIVKWMYLRSWTSLDALLARLKCNPPNPNGIILALTLIYTDASQSTEDCNDRVRHTLFELIGKAESIASHPTPEGLLGMSQVSLNDDTVDDELDANHDPNSSQSWRTIKEASKLLAIISTKTNDPSILDQLVKLMLRLRHPGAFCSLVDPLTALASHFSFDCAGLIDRHLISFPEVSTTRRSAGLPLCLKALLLGNIQRLQREDKTGRLQARECRRVADLLIDLVMKDGNASDGGSAMSSVSLVHASNCLRALMREARLSLHLTPAIPALTKFCFSQFASKEWSVRNSAAMLFFALIVKVFGSDHNRVRVDERELRRRVPGFMECILELIARTAGMAGSDGKGCFQIMCILTRITPHSRQCRRLFGEYLGRMVGHQEIRIRTKAARMLGELDLVAEDGVVLRPCWNAIHGHMLMQRQLDWSPSLMPPSIYAPQENTALDEIAGYFQRWHGDALVGLARKASIPRLCQLIKEDVLARTAAILRVDVLREPALLQHMVESGACLSGEEVERLQCIALPTPTRISHYGLTLALLKHARTSLEFVQAALNAAPLNDDIVELTLPRLAHTDQFLSLVDKYSEEGMTDVVRFAACTAYTRYLSDSIAVVEGKGGMSGEDAERCKRFLWDDDEDVRQLMAGRVSALWGLEGEASVANALFRIYTLFPTPFCRKGASQVEEDERDVLFGEEPRNAFWDEGWERIALAHIAALNAANS